jgi:hypothetical protein
VVRSFLPFPTQCGTRSEVEVVDAERAELGDAQSRLQCEDEERVVTPARPARTVRACEQRVDLVWDEEAHECPFAPLGGDGKDAADERGVLGVPERREGKQRPDRGEPDVAALDRQAPGALEVIEEAPDHLGVEVGEAELGRRNAGRLLHVGDQQLEAVAIGGNGVRARMPLRHEPLGEERLEGRRDEAHRSPSKTASSRAATGAMSSGVEVRYQYVDAGFTWPITVDSSGKSAPTSAPASCQEVSVETAKRWRKSCSRGRQAGDVATTPAWRQRRENVRCTAA